MTSMKLTKAKKDYKDQKIAFKLKEIELAESRCNHCTFKAKNNSTTMFVDFDFEKFASNFDLISRYLMKSYQVF